MDCSIVYNDDIKKFVVSPQLLEVIKNLSKKDFSYKNERKELTTEFDSFDFRLKIDDIINRAIIHIKYIPSQDNEIAYDVTKLNSLVQQFEDLYPKDVRERNGYYHFEKLENDVISKLLFIINDIQNEIDNYYLTRDLINAKDDCLKNMEYFLDQSTINNWHDQYEKAIKARDIEKMKSMVKNVQNMIRQEWANYFQNLENMTDDNFCFIGHSTNSTEFSKEFYSDYVSASLFTQDLTDTYRSGFGFILAPKNIVGAKGQDMFVNNYVNNDESMLNYSSIPKIDHPKRVIEETTKQKNENIKNHINRKVYSEVIIKGFEPIGIFCFTDGSKKINQNQQNAEKLKLSFPNLNIYSFDVMKRKKGQNLITIKLKLLNNIQAKVAPNSYEIKEDMLEQFTYFFEQFAILKQSSDYDEKMIEDLFNYNKKMLSPFDTNPDELFNGQFSEKDIEYILRKNYKYNFDSIMAGEAKAFILNNLKQLIPYKDKLTNMFEGIDVLLDILSKIDISEEMMMEINNLKPLNFLTISKYLATKLMNDVNSRENTAKNELANLEKKYKSLVSEYEERALLKEKYQYYREIDSHKYFFDIIKKDYQELREELNIENLKDTNLKLKLAELQKESSNLSQLSKENLAKNYNDTSEHFEYVKALEEISLNIANLSKNPLLKWKKIKDSKKKIKDLTKKEQQEQRKFKAEQELQQKFYENEINVLNDEIENLKINIEFNKEKITKLNDELTTLQEKIKSYYKCDSIDQVESQLKESEQFLKHYDIFNSVRLLDLQANIEQLNTQILETQSTLQSVQEEKETISKGM